jgi:steroid 5-alpha reductase family enzyme
MISVLFATFVVTVMAFTLLWAVSLGKRDASIVDFYWGPGFAVIAVLAWLMALPGTTGHLIWMPVTLWGLRLGWHMIRRHKGEEDPRYRAMRERHGPDFGRKSLWMVFWLQALIQWIASSPALVAAIAPAVHSGNWLQFGLTVFLIGLMIEVWADRELSRFRADPANKDKLLTSGMFEHIRHPNYLGEIILQWGLGIAAFGMTNNLLAFIGPVLMTGLIAKLSGVPMLEEQLRGRPGFEEWRARTGALLPKFR